MFSGVLSPVTRRAKCVLFTRDSQFNARATRATNELLARLVVMAIKADLKKKKKVRYAESESERSNCCLLDVDWR